MGNANRQATATQNAEQQADDCSYNYVLLLFAARDGDFKTVRFLLENKAVVDIRNSYGATPLHFAASCGHRKVARALLKHGASVNATDSSGKTPLLRAAANGDAKLVRLLLKHGADASIRDAFGWTARRLAVNARHYKVLATLRYYSNRNSQPPTSCSSTTNLQSSATRQEKLDNSFASLVIEPVSQPRRTELKPLRPVR